MDDIITPTVELVVKSMNASARRDAASVTVISKRWEQVAISALHKNVSDKSSTFRELNLTDELRVYNPVKESEFLRSEARVDRQPYIHHI